MYKLSVYFYITFKDISKRRSRRGCLNIIHFKVDGYRAVIGHAHAVIMQQMLHVVIQIMVTRKHIFRFKACVVRFLILI